MRQEKTLKPVANFIL
jgi:RanBP1 domain